MSYIDITINGKRITSSNGKIFINNNEVIENQFTDKPYQLLIAIVVCSFAAGMVAGLVLPLI